MLGKVVNAGYVLNIIFQSFFTLLTPAGLCFLISFLLVKYASLPEWIYAPFLIVGILAGFASMIKFIISAMNGLERLEKSQKESRAARALAEEKAKERAKGSEDGSTETK